MASLFPISEEEYRKIVRTIERRRRASSSALKAIEEDEMADSPTVAMFQAEIDTYDDVLDHLYWWEHDRGKEDGL